MDLRSLDYFIHAAKSLNFTQAAKECYISQTAVSLAIAKLEDELGFLLFERNNRVVGLTEAGEEFYNWASQILQSYDNAVKRCTNIASGYSGEIAIAFASFLDGLFFMPQLKDFKRRYPNVQIRIHTLSPNYMQQALKTREIDVAVCWPYDFLADDDLTVYDLCNMNLILAVNTLHPFASMERIPAELMKNETCYMLSASNQQLTKKSLQSELIRAGLSELNICGCSHTEEVFMQLELNNSIALVPDYFRSFTNSQIVYREMDIDKKLGAVLTFCNLESNKNPTLDLLRRSMRKQNISDADKGFFAE
ncbi:MAG TPA: LysR family transcriptional regulator [Clostridiaceae bacterium]|nr:LysR family transcriptional regulator [Clostridiaceae bacterium]